SADIAVMICLADQEETNVNTLRQILTHLAKAEMQSGLLVVFETADQFSKWTSDFSSFGVAIGSADNPTQIKKIAEALIQEIRIGARVPIRRLAELFRELAKKPSSEMEAASQLGRKETDIDAGEEDDEAGDFGFDDLQESDFTEYAWEVLQVARHLG